MSKKTHATDEVRDFPKMFTKMASFHANIKIFQKFDFKNSNLKRPPVASLCNFRFSNFHRPGFLKPIISLMSTL